MPFNPKFTITPKVNKTLVEIERVRGVLDAVKLKDDWLADMQKEALRLESHHSAHIEGTALSRDLDNLMGKGIIKTVAKSQTDPTKHLMSCCDKLL